MGQFFKTYFISFQASFFEAKETKLPIVRTECGSLEFPQTSPITVQQPTKPTLTFSDCIQIEKETRGQTNNPKWFKERERRLTSSNFGKIIKRKSITEKFIKCLIKPASFTSEPTSYGKNNETNAIQNYIKRTGNHVHDCGIIINPEFSFLGSSPDGKVCDQGITGLIEVKCPFSARDMSVAEATNEISDFCLEYSDNDTLVLKHDHIFHYQIQGQLMVSGAEFCDFVVYTRKDLFIQRIFPDITFMNNMYDKLFNFYVKYFLPALDE